MSKQPATLNDKVGTFEKFAYGCGDLASNLVLALTTGYITFFYTDALGLNVAIIGAIILISSLFDGISDVVMGYVMDKVKSKHGNARPWMLWLAVPFGLATALLMTVPQSWNDTAKYIYVFLTYNITTTFLYTAINIPYGALNSLMTRDQHERESINIWRMTMAQIGALVIQSLTLPLVNAIGDSGDQRSWIILACIYGALAAGLFLLCFFNTKERVHATTEADRKIGFGKTLKIIVKNTPWLLICAIWVVMALGMGLSMGVGTYYCKYHLKNEELVGLLGAVQTISMLLCMPFLGKPIIKYGKRNVALVGGIVTVIAQVMMLASPYSVPWLLFCCAVHGIAASTSTATIFAMVADSIEYGQWKTGVRVEGTLYSATTFGAKLGGGAGMAIATSILGAAGYDGLAAVQTESAMNAIYNLYLIVPIIFLAALPVILYFYKLDKIYPQVMADLAERESK